MQALVLLTDQKICLRQDKKDVEEEVKKVKEMGVNILPVGIGPHIDIRELEGINRDGHKIMHFGEYANPKTVGNSIFNGMFMVDAGFCIKTKIVTCAEESIGRFKQNIEVMEWMSRELMRVFLFFFLSAPGKGFSW